MSPPLFSGRNDLEKFSRASMSTMIEVLVPVAVPPLGSVEERVGVASMGVREPDDAREHAARGVRGEPHDEVAHEVGPLLHIVEPSRP